jgi:hypothetical protein
MRADAPERVTKRPKIVRALNPENLFLKLALFVRGAVIKWANENAGDSDYEHISGSANHALALVYWALCPFARRMR